MSQLIAHFFVAIPVLLILFLDKKRNKEIKLGILKIDTQSIL